MPLSRMTCSVCGAELSYDPRKAPKDAAGKVACPYDRLAHAALRAGHDRIYFGRWRKMEATPGDIRRAYNQIERHLRDISRVIEGRDLPAARRDLLKAYEALHLGDPREGGPEVLRFMDHALSYAHRTIDDLLHEEGMPPHDPMAFSEWYDVAEVPFRDEW
jgi:hypothetical protein